MLYQLSGKCNVELKPKGRYDASMLYSFEDDDTFLNDACTVVSSLNAKVEEKQTWFRKIVDNMRMTRSAMSPATKAVFVMAVFLLAGMTVVGCMYTNMKELTQENKRVNPKDIKDMPDFGYLQADLERKDSGVQQARKMFRSPKFQNSHRHEGIPPSFSNETGNYTL